MIFVKHPLALKREEIKKRNIFFLAVTILFLAYCIPIIIQGTDDFRMIDTFHPDEGTAVTLLSRMIRESSLYPRGYHKYSDGFFHYGAIYFYIDYFGMLVIKNIFFLESISDKMIIISLRLINVIFAILSLGGLYVLSRRIYNFSVAILAGLFLIFTPRVVYWSTNAHPDILQMFFIIISIYFSIRLLEKFSYKYIALSTIFAGLAFGTKYSGIFLLPFICLISIIPLLKQKRGSYVQRARKILFVLMIIVILFLITFSITNPYALIEFKKFHYTIRYEIDHIKFGHQIKEDVNPLVWFKVLSDPRLLGKVGLVLFFIFIIITVVELRVKKINRLWLHKRRFFILGWIFFFLIYLMWSVNYRTWRYLFPIIPFIYIFIAHVISRLFYNRYSIKIPRRLGQLTAIGLVVLVLWPKISLNYVHLNSNLHKVENNPAVEAGRYLEENFPENMKITYDYYSYVPSSFKYATWSYGQNEALINEIKPDLIIVNDDISHRYEDLRQAGLSKNPEYFRSCHLFYAKLENNQFSPYQKIKDFGRVRIYKRY